MTGRRWRVKKRPTSLPWRPEAWAVFAPDGERVAFYETHSAAIAHAQFYASRIPLPRQEQR